MIYSYDKFNLFGDTEWMVDTQKSYFFAGRNLSTKKLPNLIISYLLLKSRISWVKSTWNVLVEIGTHIFVQKNKYFIQ